MIEGRRGPVAVLFVLALASAAARAADGADRAVDPGARTVDGYLDALRAGDWAGARTFWRPVDLERAARLGIRYRDLPLKVDGYSPLGGVPPPNGNMYTAVASADGAWQLASPVGLVLEDCAAREGAVATGRYVRAVTGPGQGGREPALAALDSFAADVLERLGVPEPRRRRLEHAKIDYLFVAPEQVEHLAGAPTVGVANLQLDVVVTHHPCHLHELAHILVNYWLEELPLFTLPVLQEGVAVHLGGRWGRGPGFLAPVGQYFLETGYVAAADLLARGDFHAQGADLAYPAAGVVAGWVLEGGGPAALAGVYRQLSGTAGAVDALTTERAAAALAQTLAVADTTAAGFGAALAEYLDRLPGNPLRPAWAVPASPPLRQLAADGLDLDLWREDGHWLVVVTAPKGREPVGSLVVPGGAAAPSSLFAEHFPDDPGPTAVAALHFSPAETGWYDYGRDMLLAKHIASFWPEPPCYDPRTRTLQLAWPDSLVAWDLAGGPLELRPAGDR